MSKALALNQNEKSIGNDLKKTVRLLQESREEAVKSMAETISLAADAGDIIANARTQGLDVEAILEIAEINGEEGRRLERVAKARPSLTNPQPGCAAQTRCQPCNQIACKQSAWPPS